MLKDSPQDLDKNDHFNSLVPETPIDRRTFIAAAIGAVFAVAANPVLGLYAGADQGIPPEHVERMRAGLRAFEKDKRNPIHVYPDVPHAFHADYRPSYRKAEAEDGWKRMLTWFKKHGVA